mmetsp:Transcript_12237/g.33404  ORF Transcript_12237/g.33404 Transcript_12237/m.33404 type:complete len:216 (+) Transcript_12237:1422-2069(+)
MHRLQHTVSLQQTPFSVRSTSQSPLNQEAQPAASKLLLLLLLLFVFAIPLLGAMLLVCACDTAPLLKLCTALPTSLTPRFLLLPLHLKSIRTIHTIPLLHLPFLTLTAAAAADAAAAPLLRSLTPRPWFPSDTLGPRTTRSPLLWFDHTALLLLLLLPFLAHIAGPVPPPTIPAGLGLLWPDTALCMAAWGRVEGNVHRNTPHLALRQKGWVAWQ